MLWTHCGMPMIGCKIMALKFIRFLLEFRFE